MESHLIFNLLAVILLVMGNAFFVGSEIALTSARRSRIKQLADTGNKAARTVQLLHKEPERFYSVTQIGITLVSLALGAIGITTMEHLIDPVFEAMAVSFSGGQSLVDVAHTAAYIFGFVVISFLHVVGGELAPKVLAFHKAETLSLAVAGIMNFLYSSLKPLIWIMNKSSEGLLWVFGQRDLAKEGAGHFSITEEEIRTILTASEHDGVLNAEETQMIRGCSTSTSSRSGMPWCRVPISPP
jgi:CBS domain containing-hemolysin-like protein